MTEYDFSAIESALDKAQDEAAQGGATQHAPPPSTVKLNTQELLEEIQQQKKEHELVAKIKGQKKKKFDRPKGYFDKMKAADKTRKKALKDKAPQNKRKPKK